MLTVLVLVLELALAVVESEATRAMAEPLLMSGVLASFAVVAVAAGVGEGAAAADPAGFCSVRVCMCMCVRQYLRMRSHAYMWVEIRSPEKRSPSIKLRTLLVLPETLPHLRSVSMETSRLYLKYGYAETKGLEDKNLSS